MQQAYSTRRTDPNNSIRKSITSQDIKILQCKFHPNNDLHTFCNSPQCMLPMCSTCIGIHNQDHFQSKTHGSYKDLWQMIRDTIRSIEEQQTVLEELSAEYVEDYNWKLSTPEKCRQVVQKARVKAHEEVDRVFDRFSIQLQEKISNYIEQIHQFYNSLQDRIHNNYKVLAKQKQDLTLINGPSSITDSKHSFTKRSNQQIGSSQNYSISLNNQFFKNLQTQRSDHKKQDRKILKTLIQYHSYKLDEVNYKKIVKLKQQIKQLKGLVFQLQCDILQINKFLNNICNSSIRIKNSLQIKQTKLTPRKKQVRFRNSNTGQSQSQIAFQSPKTQVDKIMVQNNQRLKRLHIQPNYNPNAKLKGQKMQTTQEVDKIYMNNNIYRPSRS